MSKSKGNVVTPEEICEKFGADSLRIYELFVAPFEDNVQWNEDGMNGAFRFINRYWRWATSALPYYDPNWRNLHVDLSETEIKVRRKLHQTIKKVTIDLDEFRFNTAIAAIMELVNDIYIYQPLDKAPNNIALLSELLEAVVLLIPPIAPHVGEELWSRLGKTTSTYRSNWPTVDEKATIESVITVVLQVNGKVRDKMSAPAGTDTETLKSLALQHENVVEALAGNKPKTVIVVPGKLVNVVV